MKCISRNLTACAEKIPKFHGSAHLHGKTINSAVPLKIPQAMEILENCDPYKLVIVLHCGMEFSLPDCIVMYVNALA